MNFQFPLGLLALLGIPVLILIYIIKSQYTEQTIASTYLWRLSEKFLKRRPISKLTGIMKLLLQLLAVVVAALLVAHPVFTIPHSANDIYFILDCSASMNMQTDGGATRFEKAQERINKIIDRSRGGSKYSLVYVGETTDVAFEDVRDKEQAKANVNSLTAGWNSADCSSALALAQEYFDDNNSAIIYLVTDKNYETENMQLIDVSGGEKNYAFTDYGYSYTATGVRGTGSVISYSADATITVSMTLTDAAGEEFTFKTEVDAQKGESAEFTVISDVSKFASLRLSIENKDALKEDNEVILYDEAKAQSRKVLLVNNSQDGLYLRNALSTAGRAAVEMVSAKDFSLEEYKGYGMYVFNGVEPQTLPKNAAVWLVNAVDGSVNNSSSGISYRGTQVPTDATGPNSYYVPKYTTGTSAQEKLLMKDVVARDMAIRQYARYGVPRNFVSLLKVNGDSVIAAGVNKNNDREVVFAFSIGDSNFGMQDNFLVLVRNLMNYSFPSVIDETTYTCGDTMYVNVVSGCESIVVKSPSGKSTTLDTVDNAVCEVQLNETGTYVITVKTTGVDDAVLYAYACVPEEESGVTAGGVLALAGEKQNEYSDGFYDKLLPFLIIIAVVLLADWGLYCYEQHQLR